MQRILGIGTLTIAVAGDAEGGDEIKMHGVPEPKLVADAIRGAGK